MIKFYTDTHIHKAVAVQLRLRGIDIVRCQDVGLDNASDVDHLEYATGQGRSVVTNDADFKALHEEWLQNGKQHAGIFYVTRNKEDIGMIVTTLEFFHDAVTGNAVNLETEVFNQLYCLPWR